MAGALRRQVLLLYFMSSDANKFLLCQIIFQNLRDQVVWCDLQSQFTAEQNPNSAFPEQLDKKLKQTVAPLIKGLRESKQLSVKYQVCMMCTHTHTFPSNYRGPKNAKGLLQSEFGLSLNFVLRVNQINPSGCHKAQQSIMVKIISK